MKRKLFLWRSLWLLALLSKRTESADTFSTCFDGDALVLLDLGSSGNFDQCQALCQGLSGNLARITTREQYDFGMDFLITTMEAEGNPISRTWIGLQDFGNTGLEGNDPARFSFLGGFEGEDRSFVNDLSENGPWIAEQPNNFGIQNCIAYNLEPELLDWADFDCADVNRGLCRVPCPTPNPTTSPSISPTKNPTVSPTPPIPTTAPTFAPTKSPIQIPTVSPTTFPTSAPVVPPTASPTTTPTFPVPTSSPSTLSPTAEEDDILGFASKEMVAGAGVIFLLFVFFLLIFLHKRTEVATKRRRRKRSEIARSKKKSLALEVGDAPAAPYASDMFMDGNAGPNGPDNPNMFIDLTMDDI